MTFVTLRLVNAGACVCYVLLMNTTTVYQLQATNPGSAGYCHADSEVFTDKDQAEDICRHTQASADKHKSGNVWRVVPLRVTLP